MARRTYTLTELLGLRTNRVPNEVLANANDPEIGTITRTHCFSFLAICLTCESSSASCRPPTSRHKDDSSVTSDELIFKGTVSRRMGRDFAREASQNSIRGLTREIPRGAVQAVGPESAQNPPHPMEWKYRGRSDTEATTAEPIPAPTGVSAQRDEGFQRFYKAVVSPTHVRVTAGGRIVPNTRGPPSPTTKRANDNSIMDSHGFSDKAAISQQPTAPVSLSQAVPIVSPLVTGYPSGFQPLQTPVSFVPMTLGAHLHPGFPFPQGAVSPASMAQFVPTSALKDLHSTKATEDDKQSKTKASLSEPFYYNSQLICPVGAFPGPLGSPVVPVHMVGISQGVAPQLPGNYTQPQSTQASSAATGSSYALSNRSLSGLPPVVNHIVPANANFSGNTAPPISSIKPSDITKKQIASFKQSLKYHEDQLQYNRHQIDEKDMEQRIQIIKGHIQRFEQTLKTQLEYEEAHFKATQGKNNGAPAQAGMAVEENKAQPQPPTLTVPLGYGAPGIKKEPDESVNQGVALATHGTTTNVDQSGKPLGKSHVEPVSTGISSRPNAAGLPNEAATAPIFQPRGYASTWTGSKYAREMKACEEADKRIHALEVENTESLCEGEQRSVSQPFSASMAAAPHSESSLHGSDERRRSGSNSTKPLSGYGVPYLLGTLPKGVNPRTARDQDYVYKRPLTEEERRARFLYWGKAPKSAVRGLPKYDGKHFYPPSPIKEPSAEQAQDSSCRTTDSDGDPFRPMTPVQRVNIKGVSVSEDNCVSARLTRTISFETQVNGGSEDFTGGAPLKCENSLDAAVGQSDRRSDNTSAKLWQAVLRKGATSSALSSTTAQGFLPHCTGNAAASLTPSLSTNQISSTRDISSGKLSDVHDLSENSGPAPSNVPEKRGENCPPSGVSSLEDQFKHLAVDDATRREMAPAFSM
ncbi:uncharacterized protein P884DRAFT_314686 [Thermothelomyces heterothallicus CBS 202.75]|uniref:uncharacterized protein n=1 Tax=Thermothelomyces heterothallicus CBS 202.75 TaxID=1149848 RepID=UPI0037425DE7